MDLQNVRSLPGFSWLSSHPKTIAGIAGIFLVCWFIFGRGSSSNASAEYKTVPVEKGDIDINVNATGTVEPEELVDVGAQIAGKIESLGVDKQGKSIDYGSEVEEGAILAKIDQSLYAADVAQADAQLKRSNADVLQSKAKLFQAQRDWERAQKLGPSDALSQSAFDGYRANFDAANAAVGVSEAAVKQADAALAKAKQNLAYCIIRSPVSGVIIDRRVSIGQTVVSSLNAPSLFLIAKDLKRMQVWAAVNEADIGSIRAGQNVIFRVDAFPSTDFQGTVGKIRLNASMSQNVVTYIVEVNADNTSGKLLPYLTANVTFEIVKREGVLLVPNAALRWAPPENEHEKGQRQAGEHRRGDKSEAAGGTVWTLENGTPRPQHVKVGGTDGTRTEIEGPNITEGLAVVIGQQTPEQAASQSSSGTNPFAPPMRPRRSGK